MRHLPGSLFLRNLIERRALILELVRRDFEQRYIGSAAGWLWGVIHPLVLLLSWTFVFNICLKVTLPRGEVTQDYTLFLIAGWMPWFLFQETVQRSANSMVDQSNLITKTVFPSEIIPLSIFFSTLINHLFTLILVVIAIALTTHHLSWHLVFLPIYMFLTGLLAVGIGWFAASLQVYLRDTAQMISVVMTLWFWLTPIFVFEQQYPPEVQWLLEYNPLAYLVRAYRERLLSARPPDLEEIGVIAFYSILSFFIGGLFFRQLKRGFADVL
ncbi:MAG: ABC transporter permease [Bryobacterales bacterium]|nr:ABC transporter permease [Bryobacterales bacterium]